MPRALLWPRTFTTPHPEESASSFNKGHEEDLAKQHTEIEVATTTLNAAVTEIYTNHPNFHNDPSLTSQLRFDIMWLTIGKCYKRTLPADITLADYMSKLDELYDRYVLLREMRNILAGDKADEVAELRVIERSIFQYVSE